MSVLEPENTRNWVAAWYAPPLAAIPADLTGRSLRQIIRLQGGGSRIRVSLSNRYGVAPVTISSISAGCVLNGPNLHPGAKPVLFNRENALTLPPGQEISSDPLELSVTAGSDIGLTFYVKEGDCQTGHPVGLQTSYVSKLGDFTALPGEMALAFYPLITTGRWLISRVDVLPDSPLNAVVAFGSSVTDGVGSTLDADRSWPGYLARRLTEAGGTRVMSVLNAGVSGNQLTNDNISELAAFGFPSYMAGEAGLKRLEWDLLALPGATDLIVHIASNDLRMGVSAETIIAALKEVAERARPKYQKVFGATVLPGGYTTEQNLERYKVNNWLLEASSPWYNATFDFAEALRSAADEALVDPAYDSGDGVHPNDRGYEQMAAAVKIHLLTGSPG
jgi:lysophospholipase L1-like esterase